MDQKSYMQNTKTGQKTKINYEDGQYVMYMWVPAAPEQVESARDTVLAGNRFAILAAAGEQGFTRQEGQI